MKISDISTPALILEKGTFEKNLSKMKELVEKYGIMLRPHYKSNKCPYIAKKQIELGAVGVCCAKLGEAFDLVDNGVENVLIANEIVTEKKIKDMAHLAKRAKLTVLVDSIENANNIEKALTEADSFMSCYAELDTGMNRCGGNVEETVELSLWIKNNLKRLSLEGIQAYAGHLSHEKDGEKRCREAEGVINKVKEVVTALKEKGIEVPVVSGISTGTLEDKAPYKVYNEAQLYFFGFVL